MWHPLTGWWYIHTWGGMIREPNGKRFTRLGPNKMQSRPAIVQHELSWAPFVYPPVHSHLEPVDFPCIRRSQRKVAFDEPFPEEPVRSQPTESWRLVISPCRLVQPWGLPFGEICFNLLWGLRPFDYETWRWHRLPQHQPNASQNASFEGGWPIAMPYAHILEFSLKHPSQSYQAIKN